MDQLQDFLKQQKLAGDVAMAPTRSSTGQNAGREMGVPFGRGIGAMIKVGQVEYLVTTNADYIPVLPANPHHNVFIRRDLRYGEDDFTQWPQQFSERYCHLGAIRTPQGLPAEWAILSWNPQSPDFVKQGSPTATEALGKLHTVQWSALAAVVDELQTDYKRYTQLLSEQQVPAAIRALVVSMDLAIQRLQTVPATEEETFLAVRNLQRTLLELDAALTYMTVYKKRMESPALTNSTPPAEKLVGTYTGDARIAQRLGMAGLPYWYIHPHGVLPEKDAPIVTPHSPQSLLELAPHPNHSAICTSTNNTDVKVEAIHKVAHSIECTKILGRHARQLIASLSALSSTVTLKSQGKELA
ncbi:hypothetical protein B0H17DRAFT_1148771 [Mycena rosella]|uniref:Uncharacterized protein n=1 Tax=Mycena rosella TaxID=1033263 RepID=A0AAD7CA34_MYCRO|nr:hypothetical protein B0H17DRAFT_1148771 [Mycena rosella]